MSHDDLHNKSRITKEALIAFVELCNALVDAVKDAGPQGAPAGPLYAACMSAGIPLEQFERLMNTLVRAGRLRKSGHLYFYAEPQQPETKQ